MFPSLSKLLCSLTALSFIAVQASAPASTASCRKAWEPNPGHPHPAPFRGPSCLQLDDPNDVSDCSAGCYCNARSRDSKLGICNTAEDCGTTCKTDHDCPKGQACAAGYFSNCPGNATCVAYAGCTGPFGTGS